MGKLEYIGGKSDWIDLRAAEDVELKQGEFKLIPLGVAMTGVMASAFLTTSSKHTSPTSFPSLFRLMPTMYPERHHDHLG